MERLRTVIASDKEKKGLRAHLQEQIEGTQNLEVVQLSRLKTSKIREIKKQEPDIVLIAASLNTPEEVKELGGFVRKARRLLPETRIVIQAPSLFEEQMEEVFESGADAWIDERMAYEYLGGALESIATGKDLAHPMVIRKK